MSITGLDESPPMPHPVRVNMMQPTTEAPSRIRTCLRLGLVVLLVALPVRLYLALTASMLSRDGVTFIWYAQKLGQAPIEEMRKQDQHPLYPAAILGAHGLIEHVGGWFRTIIPSIGGTLDDPVKSWALAGVSVTLTGGLAVILAVYWLSVELFDRKVALWAAVLAALTAEFCQLSADALTDMPHLSLYLCSLCAAIKGIKRLSRLSASTHQGGNSGSSPLTDRGLWMGSERFTTGGTAPSRGTAGFIWLFVAGLLSGGAYLVRPEGGEAGVVACIGALLFTGRARFHRRLLAVAAVCLGVAIMATPYMTITGKLVQKKSLPNLFKFFQPAVMQTPDAIVKLATVSSDGPGALNGGSHRSRPSPFSRSSVPMAALVDGSDVILKREARGGPVTASLLGPALAASGPSSLAATPIHKRKNLIRAALLVLDHWSRVLRVTLTLPPIIWLFLRRRVPAERTATRLVAVAAILHIMVLIRLLFGFDYWEEFSLRHSLVLAGFTLPFTAAGVIAVLALIPVPRRRILGLAMLLGLILPTTPWMFEQRYTQDAYLRQAGEWIRLRQPAGSKVQTNRHTVAFYANGIWKWSPRPEELDVDRVLLEARKEHPDYLVFDEQKTITQTPSFFADLESRLQPGEALLRVHATEQISKGKKQRAFIYHYHPPT